MPTLPIFGFSVAEMKAPTFWVCRIILVASCVLAAMDRPASAFITPEERARLDMSRFRVTDRAASLLDAPARSALLRNTDDPQLISARDQLTMGVSCRSLASRPVLEGKIVVPSFYDDPSEWKVATQPLLDFEDMMSNLSGAWVASGDPYYANCLVDILAQWAGAGALNDFSYSQRRAQAWYAVESMIFSAAIAYSTVVGSTTIPPDKRTLIEDWLRDISWHHFRIEGSPQTCCNNHYYRRALYMTVVGVVTGDDEMFREGLRAPFAALHDLDSRGAFKLALTRGWRVIHYQNYSLLYLITNLQFAFRQGYDLFDLEVNGKSMADAVGFLLDSLENPYAVEGLPDGEQDLGFTNDPQYFSWMEIWLRHFDDPRMAKFLRLHRPVYNRGAGGHLTLLFKQPETPRDLLARQIAVFRNRADAEAPIGSAYPYLRQWKNAP